MSHNQVAKLREVPIKKKVEVTWFFNIAFSKVQKDIDGTKVSYLSDSPPLVRQSDGKNK